jgi:hypothetical protein
MAIKNTLFICSLKLEVNSIRFANDRGRRKELYSKASIWYVTRKQCLITYILFEKNIGGSTTAK